MTLSPERMKQVYEIQRGLHQKFREVDRMGKVVEYFGRKWVVYPSVFWPHSDSQPLLENYKINPGETVCDVCCGSGIIGIDAALKGASQVVSLDINIAAIRSTSVNSYRFGVDGIVEPRLSDVFSALEADEKFDVITMNPPFTDHKSEKYDNAEKTIWDENLHVQSTFFKNLGRHLKPNGRAYISQANFGNFEDVLEMARDNHYQIKEIGRKKMDDLRTFLAYEIKRE